VNEKWGSKWGMSRKDLILFLSGYLNLYEYAIGDPINFFDWLVLWTLPWLYEQCERWFGKELKEQSCKDNPAVYAAVKDRFEFCEKVIDDWTMIAVNDSR